MTDLGDCAQQALFQQRDSPALTADVGLAAPTPGGLTGPAGRMPSKSQRVGDYHETSPQLNHIFY